MSDHTPTNKDISAAWAMDLDRGERAEFEAWLKAHDAEVAEAERKAITAHLSSSSMVTIAGRGGALEWLRSRTLAGRGTPEPTTGADQ
jgi:hypothetical protein